MEIMAVSRKIEVSQVCERAIGELSWLRANVAGVVAILSA